MPDTLAPHSSHPCPPTDANLAREHGRYADARPGYSDLDAETLKREKYAQHITPEGFHVRSAAVVYCRRILELVRECGAQSHDQDRVQDIVRDLVRFAAWPGLDGGLSPMAPSKDWFAPTDSVRFAGMSASGPTKHIIDRAAYQAFVSFGGQQVRAFDAEDAPVVPNRDAHVVFSVLQALAAESVQADPAHVGPEETVRRYRMLALLLANLLGLEKEVRRPVTVLVPARRRGAPSVAITVGADVAR